MIRDWQEHSLNMDFSHIDTKYGRPSDIDMWYITPSNFLIIGEIKNSKGRFNDGQKALLKRIVDSHKGGGTILYITHNQDVHRGDTIVDVSRCKVSEYYWHGKWRTPKQYTTVNEAFNKLLNGIL